MRIFVSFQKQLAQEKKLDLDDFAAAVCHLFRTNPAELARWQREYSYLLVDEFQDINAAQYEAVKLLCGGKRNLFVVGDDDQAIYGFRGSDPAIMRQFLKDFPEAKQIFVTNAKGEQKVELEEVGEGSGFFGLYVDGKKYKSDYLLHIYYGENDVVVTADPYAFEPQISSDDLYLFAEGKHYQIYDKLGAHPMTINGVTLDSSGI